MPDTSPLSFPALGELAAAVVPVVVGVAFLFKNTDSTVKAAVALESKARHDLANSVQRQITGLDSRTQTLERTAATKDDLTATEQRITANLSDVKIEMKEVRGTMTSILEKVAAIKAHMTGKHSEPDC